MNNFIIYKKILCKNYNFHYITYYINSAFSSLSSDFFLLTAVMTVTNMSRGFTKICQTSDEEDIFLN